MAIDTIVVAVGPIDAVRVGALADATAEVATPLGATVVVVHAFTGTEYEGFRESLGFEARVEDVDPDEVAARRTPVPELRERLETAGADVEVRGAVGEAGPAVVELAEGVDADRIVVGGRRRSAAGKAVYGSTSQEVMGSAPCPVTYVRDSELVE